MKRCYLCDSKDFERVKGKVRDLSDMPILKCRKCGLVFLGNFDHIDDNFYKESKMRAKQPIKDWRLYLKECSDDDTRRAEWLKPKIKGKSVLDFGCGGGGFLKKIKNSAKKCAGVEKDKNLKELIKDRFKIPVYSDIEDIIDGKFDTITLFHVLEHFKDPMNILIKLSKLLNKNGNMIIEVPNSNDALLSLYGCRAFSEFTYWSCHLFLFTSINLKKLVKSAGLDVEYIKQIQRYPISNHLYWLSKGKSGGHKIWDFLDSEELNDAYEARLSEAGICDTIIASVRTAR